MSEEGSASEGAAAEAAGALVGTVIAERYRIDQLLGVGGMGAVYRAEHVLMQKPVAVKVLHREMTVLDEVVKRFEREAIAAGRIDHPNVTVATDFGKLADGAFYLVLEYVPGQSLTRAILREKPFSEERALFIARQIAAALGAAHAAGIVHRDLKPDNVMLIERAGTPDFVKVLDFGIAKIQSTSGASSNLTRVGSVFGTPAYMAPEQAAGKPVDHRADLYALGLVLYEMLAGRPAFEAEELVALLTKQLIEPPPPLPETISPETRDLVMRLLEKDPAARYQSTDELIAAIDQRLGPLSFQPDSSLLSVSGVRGAPPSESAVARAGTVRLSPPSGSPVSALVAKARTALSPGEALEVAGVRVENRWLALGAAGLLLVGVVFGIAHRGPRGIATSPSAEPAPPELTDVIRKAEGGNREAIAELMRRPERARTSAEWVAIGRGRSALGEQAAALDAFDRALALDGTLAKDLALVHAVRLAADDDKTQKRALELAANRLGENGADLLFDVWTSTQERTEGTRLAKSLLDKEEVKSHASRPLRIALDLRRATKCEDAKRLVLEAKEAGDERSVRPLSQLSARSGCGFLGLADCYPCLRGADDSLGDARKAVQDRKAPKL
ncbi:MAG TPA: serine/threonine-protein kinase [Polyangiaceae bacterium]|nr:serine/threonine-protein kinase [Polyangiaceae bacterium]